MPRLGPRLFSDPTLDLDRRFHQNLFGIRETRHSTGESLCDSHISWPLELERLQPCFPMGFAFRVLDEVENQMMNGSDMLHFLQSGLLSWSSVGLKPLHNDQPITVQPQYEIRTRPGFQTASKSPTLFSKASGNCQKGKYTVVLTSRFNTRPSSDSLHQPSDTPRSPF